MFLSSWGRIRFSPKTVNRPRLSVDVEPGDQRLLPNLGLFSSCALPVPRPAPENDRFCFPCLFGPKAEMREGRQIPRVRLRPPRATGYLLRLWDFLISARHCRRFCLKARASWLSLPQDCSASAKPFSKHFTASLARPAYTRATP